MMLGVFIALGVFAILVGCVFALMVRIDRIADGLHRRIDDLSARTWLTHSAGRPELISEPGRVE